MKIRPIFRHAFNVFNVLSPPTQWFGARRWIGRMAGIVIQEEAKITGRVSLLGSGNLAIGSNTWIGIGTSFIASENSWISIGENCDVAPFVLFHNGTHEIGSSTRRAGQGKSESITIGRGTWIGAKATILCGVVLGPGSVVAAGAVVLSGSYPANSLLAGVPARIVRSLPAD